MGNSKLGLDFNKISSAKKIAADIAHDVQDFVDNYTTVAVERTLCRLIGIDNVSSDSVPLPNVVVNQLLEAGVLKDGVLFYLGNAIVETKADPQTIAEKIANGELNIAKLPFIAVD